MRIQTAAAGLGQVRQRIGLLSDTHGLLRPEVESFLQGSDHIIHAGDICGPAIIEKLERIAPVTAVCGNNDSGPWADNLREKELVRLGGINIQVIHDIAELDITQLPAEVQVIVFGHSHKPVADNRSGVLYVNPGSAGPRRFKLPISAAELLIENGDVAARIHHFS